MEELDKVEDYLDIVATHLGEDGRVSEATVKQLEALVCIRDDIQEKLDNM